VGGKENLLTALLVRLGLGRRELRAWAMYDWANSAFMCTIVTAVFPIYFQREAAATLEGAEALAVMGLANTIAIAIVAVLNPFLGALADYLPIKKRMLGAFLGLGIGATAAMTFVGRGDWKLGMVLFIVASVGAFGSMAFYDALLPHIAREDEIDRVSSAGYAIGYFGGGLLLLVNAVWILKPQLFGMADAGVASRVSFVSVAVWWGLFSIPLFRTVPEPKTGPRVAGRSPLAVASSKLVRTLKELRGFRQAFLLLVAFAIYNDGINTIIKMATSYGAQIGLEAGDMIAAVLLVQFVGVPFAFLFGALAGRLGAKRAIYVALAVYVVISVLGFFMTTALHFYVLAFLVATVQGGSQALSRSLFATMIPRTKSAEFFAFFSIFEKFTGVLGPAAFTLAVTATGSGRIAILSIVVFFVVGWIVLAAVDVGQGQAAARAAEARDAAPSSA
jgi:UMF1 family MFS transporter